jgi:hypothetical protein
VALGFKLANVGVLYPGLRTLGGGAILTGLALAAIGAFVIDKKFVNAAAVALAGAVLTSFGFMHGEAVGIAVTPTVAGAYGIVAVFLYAPGRYPALAPGPDEVAATLWSERNRAARQCRLRRPFCIAAKADFVGLDLTQETLNAPFYRKLLALPQFNLK